MINWKDVAQRAAGHIECLLLYATTHPNDSIPRDANTFLIQLRHALGVNKPHRLQNQFRDDGLSIPFSTLPDPNDVIERAAQVADREGMGADTQMTAEARGAARAAAIIARDIRALKASG